MRISDTFPIRLGDSVDRILSIPDIEGVDEKDAWLEGSCGLKGHDLENWRRIFYMAKCVPPTPMNVGKFEILTVNVNINFGYRASDRRIWSVLVFDSEHICVGEIEGMPLSSNLKTYRELLGRESGRRRVAPVIGRHFWRHRQLGVLAEFYSVEYCNHGYIHRKGDLSWVKVYQRELAPPGFDEKLRNEFSWTTTFKRILFTRY